MKFNIFGFALLVLIHTQISHMPIKPQVVPVKIRPLVKTIPSKHIFTTSYPNFGYEISGNVYETNKQLLNQQIHNNKYYNKSQSCAFYNSQLSLQSISELQIPKGYSIQTYHVWDSEQAIFLVLSNSSFSSQENNSTRLVIKYEFDQKQIRSTDLSMSISQLGLKNDPQIDILITRVENTLLITDGVKIVAIDGKTFRKWEVNVTNQTADYQFARLDALLQFDIATLDYQNKKIKVSMLWKSVLKIYDLDVNLTSGSLSQSLKPPVGKYYTSAVVEVDYYALIQKQLIVSRQQKDGSYQTDYIDLQSQDCWQLNKEQSTIHMICKEGGVNYVAELYYNQHFNKTEDALKLNRYYTEIDDAKLIFRFGGWQNPKLLIAGQNDLMLTAFAVNRQILIESDSYQSTDRLTSFGVQFIESIQQLSPINTTFSIGIGSDSIYSFKIVETPSFIECSLQRKDNNVRWNILVEINSTSCLANGDIEQLQSICQTLIPYSLYVSLFEIDSSKQLTANLFIYVILFVISIFIVGCAFHCKKLIAKGKTSIKKKIEALKKRKGMKAI